MALVALVMLSLPALAGTARTSDEHIAGTAPATPGFIRGVYGKDSSPSGYAEVASSGFNSVMTGPYAELLGSVSTAGLKGVVWLGNFINAPTCNFEKDDATITRLVESVAGSPTIVAYYLGDEPHVTECPNAPMLFKERSQLVHGLDPGAQTFTVIQASENGVSHDYAPWAGSVDVIGFDVYPCARSSNMCNFNLIDEAVKAIRTAGIKRYWAIVQDFQDCYYRLPTAAELAGQFDHWARSDMTGYFVFSWNYQPSDPKCAGVSLDGHSSNIAQLKYENTRLFAPPAQAAAAPADSNLVSPVAVAVIVIIGLAIGVMSVAALRAKPRRGRLRH